MTAKISTKKVAIMGFIAIIAIGTTLGTASAIEPLTSPSNLIQIVDKINEIITEFTNRIVNLEDAVSNIHQHTTVRADYILGETIVNEQVIAICEAGELGIGGGYGLSDPGLRVIASIHDSDAYFITVSGTVLQSGGNAAAIITCLPLP